MHARKDLLVIFPIINSLFSYFHPNAIPRTAIVVEMQLLAGSIERSTRHSMIMDVTVMSRFTIS